MFPEYSFPDYSLLVLRPVYKEERSCIEFQDIEYIEENLETTGYRFFTKEQKEENKVLGEYMYPVDVFFRNRLMSVYVIDIQIIKIYDASELKKKLPNRLETFEHAMIVEDGRIMPGYFTIRPIFDTLPIFSRDVRDFEDIHTEYKRLPGFGAALHTYDEV